MWTEAFEGAVKVDELTTAVIKDAPRLPESGVVLLETKKRARDREKVPQINSGFFRSREVTFLLRRRRRRRESALSPETWSFSRCCH